MSKWLEKLHIDRAFLIKSVIVILSYFISVFVLERFIDIATNIDVTSVYFKTWVYIFMACVLVIFIARKNFNNYAHIYVPAIILLLGTLLIIVSPPLVGVSWDDEAHYIRSAFLSWGVNGDVSPADMEMYEYYAKTILERKEYTADGRDAWVAYIDQFDKENPTLIPEGFVFGKEYVAYIPAGIGLALGHLLDLTFTQTFMLGKFFNLLCYAVVIGLVLKLLDRGKIIATVIAMFPTNIFLAASYSYDWWVTALVLLGYAIFLGEVQKGRKLTEKKMLLIMAIMVLGLLPKAVYFLLIAPMLFWSNDRFEKPRVCRLMVIGAMAILLASFIIPLFIGGAPSDLRGGMDVNGPEQIKFILSNPIQYAIILAKFLMDYLSPDRMYRYTTSYAYIGVGHFHTIVLPLIAVACALDNKIDIDDKKEKLWTGAAGFLAAAGSIVLVATSMYVAFTTVGLGEIYGCQERYLTPILFPTMYLLCRMNIDVPKKIKDNICLISVGALAFVFLFNMLELCVISLA